jgi:hypothetical protein
MRETPPKMSEIMKAMAQTLLRNPSAEPSSEAAHIALMFANVAWNECVGMDQAREGYRSAWETIEADNPELWNEFKTNDINAMIDELVQYKKTHCSDDRRRILICGMGDGQGACGMVGPCCSWRRYQMGNAAVWTGPGGPTRRSGLFSARYTQLVPQGGN